MTRSLTFTLAGASDVIVQVEEIDVGGVTALQFTLTAQDGTPIDMRGLFWNMAGSDLPDGLSASGADVTGQAFDEGAVRDLGQGANMNGKGQAPYDAGVRFGTPGRKHDMVTETSFVLTADGDLSLDMIGGMDFGLRTTSVGGKSVTTIGYAPDAVDDVAVTDEDTVLAGNLLDNDTDGDGDVLTVTAIEGGALGAAFAVVTDGGRVASVTVNADGSYSVDPMGGFEDLGVGDSDGFTLTYAVSDGAGGMDSAEWTVVIEGVNDAPVAVDDAGVTDEDSAVTGNVLANDTDVDSAVLVVSATAGGVGVPFAVTSAGGRAAMVTINADGSYSVDPAGGFEDLGTGDSDTVSVGYTVDDGAGGTDTAVLTVTINGVNDAPVAMADTVFVEAGDTAMLNLLANDSDVDSALDPASVALGAAAAGAASVTGGVMTYDADAMAPDNVDDSVADVMVYTVADSEGATSNAATVTAYVIDPMVETATDAGAAPNGQSLSLTVSTEDRTFNDSSFLSVGIASGSVSQTVNLSFLLDGSGSLTAAEFAEQLAAVQNAIDQLRVDYSGSAAQVNVQLVQFSTNAVGAIYDLYDTGLDDVTTGTSPLASFLGGWTNYEAALQEALTFFDGTEGEDNFMFFASDGQPTRPAGGGLNPSTAYLDERDALWGTFGVEITAVGFGGGISTTTLDTLDNTGGSEVVGTAAELGDVFGDSAIFPADLLSFAVTVNGVDTGLGVGDLTALGGGDYSFDTQLLGLDHYLGAATVVEVTTGFDTDNDGLVDETRVAATVIEGTDGSDVLFA